jgi:hypothetical protein
MDTIKDTIDYLEGSIIKFNQLSKLIQSSTNQIEKRKLTETLYVIMEDAKGYIIDTNISEIGLESVNTKPYIDGLINTRYFEKYIGYFVMNLKAKIQ